MTKKQEQALVIFAVAVIVAGIAQLVMKQEAAALGLSAVEVALVGAVVGGVLTRLVA